MAYVIESACGGMGYIFYALLTKFLMKNYDWRQTLIIMGKISIKCIRLYSTTKISHQMTLNATKSE